MCIRDRYAHTASTEKNSRESIEPCNKRKAPKGILVSPWELFDYYKMCIRDRVLGERCLQKTEVNYC